MARPRTETARYLSACARLYLATGVGGDRPGWVLREPLPLPRSAPKSTDALTHSRPCSGPFRPVSRRGRSTARSAANLTRASTRPSGGAAPAVLVDRVLGGGSDCGERLRNPRGGRLYPETLEAPAISRRTSPAPVGSSRRAARARGYRRNPQGQTDLLSTARGSGPFGDPLPRRISAEPRSGEHRRPKLAAGFPRGFPREGSPDEMAKIPKPTATRCAATVYFGRVVARPKSAK